MFFSPCVTRLFHFHKVQTCLMWLKSSLPVPLYRLCCGIVSKKWTHNSRVWAFIPMLFFFFFIVLAPVFIDKEVIIHFLCEITVGLRNIHIRKGELELLNIHKNSLRWYLFCFLLCFMIAYSFIKN